VRLEDVPDEELARRAARADHRAFEQLVLRYQRRLINFAYRMLGDREDAADAVQQAFVQAHAKLPRARLDLPLQPWLFRITRNSCIDRIRARGNLTLSRLSDDNDDGSPVLSLPDTDPLPDELLERQDMERLLAGAIASLPERYRAVVALRYTSDLTFAEIGQALNIPENTAKAFFQRAKALLRVHLAARL